MDEIINKVQESGLIQLDLADHKPDIELAGIDLADQLWQGLVLREQDLREWIKVNDWTSYSEKAVYIHCTADAIIPTWAYMLVASALNGLAKEVLVGNRTDLEKQLIRRSIQSQDLEQFVDGRIIIKGCSDIPFPDYAMVEMINFLQPVARSIMYGEPCSTVPIFKRKK